MLASGGPAPLLRPHAPTLPCCETARGGTSDLRSYFDAAGDAILVHDDEGRFVEANATAARMLGYSRERLLQMTVRDLEPDFDLFGIRRRWQRMSPGEAVTVEGRPRRADGTELPVEVRLSVADPTPGARRYVAVVRDVRQREPIRAALEEAQRRFRQLVEHAGDMFFLHDSTGQVVDVNHRAAAGLGLPVTALLERNFLELATELPGAGWRSLWAALTPEVPVAVECHLRVGNGALLPVEVSVVALDWAGRRLHLAFARDVSPRLRYETELLRRAEELARSNQELDQFAAVASHDLQAPLRKILCFADLLVEDYGAHLPDDARHLLEGVAAGAHKMRVLVRDVLAYARVCSARQPFVLTDLEVVLADVLDDLQQDVRSTGAEIRVDPLPEVMADPIQMHQLAQNLVANALAYRHPDRSPRVAVTARDAGDAWELAVSDNGLGFPPERAEDLMRPFRRFHTGPAGTGLGLAICQRIAERHGGALLADGRPGEGACFTVRLPRLPPEQGPTVR